MDKEETISIIRSLLTSTKSNYTVSMLCNEFRKTAGIDMPLYGYSNVSDFLQSIPKTVKLTGLYPIQHVHLVCDEKSAHIASLVSRQKNTSKRVGGKRRRNFNQGIKLPHSFENRSNRDIESPEFTDSKPPPLTSSEKFRNLEKKNGVREIESKVHKPKPDLKDLSLHSYSSISNNSTYLSQIFSLDEKIHSVDLYFEAKIGDYVEVYPSEIINPSKFYLQLRSFKKNLTDLTNKLQVFYTNEEKKYRILPEEVNQRQTCVVLMCNTWHRAEVVKVIDDSIVSVVLVDYGIKIKSHKRNLRFLHQFFASLPKQAILSSLANIEPESSSGWSNKAIQTFFNLAYQKDLVAGVVKMDHEIPWLSVALSCTEGVEVHINDTLVKKGLARFDICDSLDDSLIIHNSREPLRSKEYYRSRKISSRDDFYYSSSASSCSISPKFYKPKNDRHAKNSYYKNNYH